MDNNFYYTIDYSGNKFVMEYQLFLYNQEFLKRVLLLLPADQKLEFSKLALTNKFGNFFYEIKNDFD